MSEGITIAFIGFAGAVLGAAIAGFASIAAAEVKKEGQNSISCGLLGFLASIGAAGGLVLGALFGSMLVRQTGFSSLPTAPMTTGSQTETPRVNIQTQVTPSGLPQIAKGSLLYEDTFDSSSGWNVEEGMTIENGNLIVRPGYDAVPQNPAQYTDFAFESRFYIPQSGSMAFYLRHQRPPCADWNCSIQIALYFNSNYQELAARRFLGDKPTQQFDIIKTGLAFLHPSNWNKIIVQVKGSEYSVYINDAFVLNFSDSRYASGAFIIDNAANSNGEIKLDYIRIYQIP